MSTATTVTTDDALAQAVGQAKQILDAHKGPVSPALCDLASAAGMKGRCFDLATAFRAANGVGFRQYWLGRNPAAVA